MRDYKSVVLPPSLKDLVNAIGESAAAAVVRTYGGTRLYVPMLAGLEENCTLVRLLSLPIARKLCFDLGGQILTIPICEWIEGDARREEIQRRIKNETVAQIALALGITERTVYRIIKNNEQPATEENR